MRISEYFKLRKTQPYLDFVDIPLDTDLPVFVDPLAIKSLKSAWGQECTYLLQNYFEAVLRYIKSSQPDKARDLLASLSERNEFHLGFSKGKSQGHGFGVKSANSVWGALSKSDAAKTGLLQDLEDTCLLIEGIGSDMLSDAVCNVIREPLIKYTQAACKYYGIPLTPNVASGPMWDPLNNQWKSCLVDLPISLYGKVILVPKNIVRHCLSYQYNSYYTHYLLPVMQLAEINANTGLVHLLKDGRKRVTKKSLREKYGTDKKSIAVQTTKHPDALINYKSNQATNFPPPINHEQFAKIENIRNISWDSLIKKLRNIPSGNDFANAYEKLVEEILSALFYPSLCNPVKQHQLHDGRKRVDITYTNEANTGFFYWLSQHYSSAMIFVECKNYGRELANPEIDQLSGRFSPSRGKVGLLVYRSAFDLELLEKRCIDTAKDDRGYILSLTDDDLIDLMDEAKKGIQSLEFPLLRNKFQRLIS